MDENLDLQGEADVGSAGNASYQLRIRGLLSDDMLLWLGFDAQRKPVANETRLVIAACDQATLYGAIIKLRDMGLALLSVEQIVEDQTD